MTAEANGAQATAAAAVPGGAVPFGNGFVGGEPPPPPAPTAVDGRLVGLERSVELITQWIEKNDQPKAKRQPPTWLTKIRQLPNRSVAVLCVGGAIAATAVGVQRFTPHRYDAAQIAAIASDQAAGTAVSALRNEIASARADATQVLVPDPFAAYGRALTEDAKTAIGYDSSTGFKSLNPARQQVVADQVREALSQRSMTLDEMRLTSVGQSQLRVHNNPADGYPLFAPPAVRAPDSMTVAPTVTSAP